MNIELATLDAGSMFFRFHPNTKALMRHANSALCFAQDPLGDFLPTRDENITNLTPLAP